MSHSLIPPSSAHIWGTRGGCTGWPQINAKYPSLGNNDAANEGNAAHELVSQMLLSPDKPLERWLGAVFNKAYVVTPEMLQYCAVYVNNIRESVREMGETAELYVEQRVGAPSIHPKLFGTVDSYIVNRPLTKLIIGDFKYGYGIHEVFENWQLLCYAAGILDRLGVNGYDDQFLDIVFKIVQPRAFHNDGPIREWKVKAVDLRGYFNVLKANAFKAVDPNRIELTSGKHCRYCKCRFACDSAIQAGLSLYETTTIGAPGHVTNDVLAHKYTIVKRGLEQLSYLKAGLEEMIESLLRKGEQVPGYTIEDGYGRETWAAPVNEVVEMGKMMGVDLKKPDVITPNQARNLGVSDEIIKTYSHRLRKGFKLVADDGKKAKQIFGVKK